MSDTDSSTSISIDSSIDNPLNAKENNGFLSDFSAEKEYQNYCTLNQENPEGLLGAQELFKRQEGEKVALKEKREKEGLGETRNKLEQEIFIDMTRVFVYEAMGIDNDKEKNGAFGNFFKGIVDEIIIGNFEFALQVWETKGKIIIDIFNQLRTVEGLKQVLIGIGASIGDLFVGDAYERGKSVGELGILFIGVGGVYKVGKLAVKGVKKGRVITKAGVMAIAITGGYETSLAFSKNIAHGNMDKKGMISGASVRKNMKKVEEDIEDIIPKQEFDIEDEVFKNLIGTIKKKDLKSLDKLGGTKFFDKKLKKLSRDLQLEKPLDSSFYIDSGSNGAIFGNGELTVDGMKMVAKIPSQFPTRHFEVELKNHQLYYSLYQEWTTKIKKEMGPDTHISLKVPKLKDIKGQLLIEDLTSHISLKRFLQRELINQRFAGKLDFDIYTLDSHELGILSKELGVEFFDDYAKVRLGLMEKKDLDLIKNFLGYSNESGLHHRDIKVDNIMVPKDISTPWNSIYLLDFGEAFVDQKHSIPRDISVKDIKNTIESDVYKYSDVMFMDILGENLLK